MAFDLVVFNASFHYSENYEKTIAEAFAARVRRGSVIIADTPWYSDEQSGRRMLQERRAAFVTRYGFPSDSLSSLEYLTDQRLGDMETGSAFVDRCISPITDYGGRCGPGWRNCAANASHPNSEST